MRIKTTMRYYLTQSECPSSKDLQTINAGEGEEKRNLHSWWECKLMQSLWRTVWSFLKKPKIELPYDPAIPLLDIYTEKTLIQKDTCTPLFIVALFTIVKTRSQLKFPLTDEWIKKMWCIYTLEYYSTKKKKRIMPFATTCMHIILIKVSQTDHMMSLICGIQNIQINSFTKQKQTHKHRKQICV